jgi:hypothetical protein
MTGTPPAASRFRKGQSGNPKGRPRKPAARSASAFDIVIDRTLTVVQEGRPREVSVDEALQHKTYLDALAGSRPARRQVLKMIAAREKAMTKAAPEQPQYVFGEISEDPVNADAALLILGIAGRDPRREGPTASGREWLLLEPWAVEAALARRTARRLRKQDLDTAQRCTRAADTLAWPKAVET